MYKWIDMHCDTLDKLVRHESSDVPLNSDTERNIYSNSFAVDLDRLNRGKCSAQFFACYANAAEYGYDYDNTYSRILDMISYVQNASKKEKGFIIARHVSDIHEAERLNKTAGVLTVEEGGVLNSRMSRLDKLYENGVRLITLTWNYENCIGYPNGRSRYAVEDGLKEFGRLVIYRMNTLGILADVSHLSDGGFWDCIQLSKVPVVASHSNARSLCPHPRNLSDEMLSALGEKGGVAGLNFYGAFLKQSGKPCLADLAEHAFYMIRKAGEDAVALGTDFDGFGAEDLPYGIKGAEDMERLWKALKNRGITSRQIDKIAYSNVMRVMKEVWK